MTENENRNQPGTPKAEKKAAPRRRFPQRKKAETQNAGDNAQTAKAPRKARAEKQQNAVKKEKPKKEPPARRGHPAVESVFGTTSDDEEFRKNNPVLDEDEEDGDDAPVYGFDED